LPNEPNKKTTCLNDLTAKILTLEIAPGSDLDEARLCEDYGVSRTPLREVLHRLGGRGLVQLSDNRSAKVASMDLATMRMFFQTAPLIYSNVARLAAEHRKTQQLDNLKQAQMLFTKATANDDVAETALMNHRFHEIIGEMSQNPYLVASLDRMLIDHTRLSQTFFAPKTETDQARIKLAKDQHDAMISAIEAQDTAVAIDLTLQHWDLSRDQMERFVRPDPLPLDVISMKDQAHAV